MDTSVQTNPESSTPAINANFDKMVDFKEMKFGFRTIKDAETGVETKRETIEVKIPVPSIEGLIAVFEAGGKGLDLLQQAVQEVIATAIKDRLSDDSSITAVNFPYADFTWEAIANQPESERKGRGISKEVWEDFIKDYIVVMPGLTGKEQKFIEKQAAILAQKLQPLKNHENKDKMLPKFKELLTVYVSGSASAEQFIECVDFINKKIDTFLNSEKDSNLESNLGF